MFISLTFDLAREENMHAYKELSRTLGEEKRMLQSTEPGGTEPSRAGKMKSRRWNRGGESKFLQVMAGHKEFLRAKRLRNAASDGSYEDVLDLVRKGVDVTRADAKGRTALHFASCRGDANLVKLLISYGASVNQKDTNGNTPLHLACCTHHLGVVSALLTAGTDVNAMDSRGVTPLHLALSRLRIARDSDDKGGLPLSRKNEITQIVEMIHKYLHVTKSSKDETDELEKLASQLSLSETPQQVDEVQHLLESFTSLTIKKRNDDAKQTPSTSSSTATPMFAGLTLQ